MSDANPSALRREYYAGGLLILVGLLAGYVATTYGLGQLDDLGAGFFPLVLSVLLVVLGLATMATAGRSAALPEGPAPMGHGERHGPDWRGWCAIVAAVVAFVVLANYAGAVPATFACVFIAALGDRHNTPLAAALLAAGITVFAAVVLIWALQVQMPMLGKL